MPDSLLQEISDDAAALNRLYDRDWLPTELTRAFTHQGRARPDTWSKLQVMSSYVVNTLRLPRFAGLAKQLGFSIRGADAVIAAYSTCHLYRLSVRQMIATGLMQVLAKAWLAIVNLGDDILDDYVAHKMPPSAVVTMARAVFSRNNVVDKAKVFVQHADAFLSAADRHDIAARFFAADGASLADKIVAAFDFASTIAACKTLSGQSITRETRSAVETSLALLFDVCMHSFAIERTTLACAAPVEAIIAIYRAKSVYFQYAFMDIAESLLKSEAAFKDNRDYIERLKKVGAVEMERSMFRDDINDLARDVLDGQPNLIVAIALSLDKANEFVLMLRLALEDKQFSMVLLKKLMPITYRRYVELQAAERERLGVSSKPVFSWFVGFCINVSSIGWRRTLRHHIAWLNGADATLRQTTPSTCRNENVRLAWLVTSRDGILERVARFGVELSPGGATIWTLLVRKGIVTVDALPLIAAYIEQARLQGDERSQNSWQQVLAERRR